MPLHRTHQQIVIDRIKKGLDIKINDPRIVPAASPGAVQRLVRRLPRSIAIRILMEDFFQEGFQVLLGHRLRNSIRDSGYP
jgi:hypothetical protein